MVKGKGVMRVVWVWLGVVWLAACGGQTAVLEPTVMVVGEQNGR